MGHMPGARNGPQLGLARCGTAGVRIARRAVFLCLCVKRFVSPNLRTSCCLEMAQIGHGFSCTHRDLAGLFEQTFIQLR